MSENTHADDRDEATDDQLASIEIDRTVEHTGETDDVPADIFEAVRDGFEDSIGHLVDSRNVTWLPADDRQLARFSFNYFEIPASATGADAGPGAWLPIYRCREEVREAIQERLPADVTLAEMNDWEIAFYPEVSR